MSIGQDGKRVPQEGNTLGVVDISADARYVAFESYGSLVDGATGINVYVRDRAAGVTELVSDGPTANGAMPNSSLLGMSPDGQHVVLMTNQALDPVDANGINDVYVRDRTTGATTLATPRNSAGHRSMAPSSSWYASSNGRFLAFATPSWWYSGGNGPGYSVLVHDIASDTTSLVLGGGQTWVDPTVSDDGRYVSAGSHELNAMRVVDRSTQRIAFAGPTNTFLFGLVSPDGSKFAYTVRDAPTGPTQVVVANIESGVSTQLTMASGDQFAVVGGSGGSWSADSGQLAFLANYAIVPEGTDDVLQIYVADMATGVVRAAPVMDGSAPDGNSYRPALANDRRSVAFASQATNLVPDDGSGVHDEIVDTAGDTVRREDVYVQGARLSTGGPARGVLPTPPCPATARHCGPPSWTPRS